MDLQDYFSNVPHGEREKELSRVATEAGVSNSAIRHWMTGLRNVPANKVLMVESLTGVSRHVLRPDVFGNSPDAVA